MMLFRVFALLLVSAAALAQDVASQPNAAATPERTNVATINAYIGECDADFHVVDKDGKPVYAAKISTVVRYGAFGLRKMELEISTGADGKAQVLGLPVSKKKPVFFDISKADKTAQRVFDPTLDCHPKWDVILQ